MRIVLFIFAFALGAFLGYGLRPYTYKGISVDEAARFLSARDIKVSKEKETASGAGYIRAEVRGYPFKVQFFQCEGEKNCQGMLFVVGFTNVGKGLGSIERMNSWNAMYGSIKAYLDDKKPTLIMPVPIRGGVTIARLEDDIETWKMLFPRFVEYMAGGNL